MSNRISWHLASIVRLGRLLFARPQIGAAVLIAAMAITGVDGLHGSVLAQADLVRIQNHGNPSLFLVNNNGQPAAAPTSADWPAGQWRLEIIGGEPYRRLLSRSPTTSYLHTQNGALELGPTLQDWASAKWLQEPAPGTPFVRFKNGASGQYLLLTATIGPLGIGKIDANSPWLAEWLPIGIGMQPLPATSGTQGQPLPATPGTQVQPAGPPVPGALVCPSGTIPNPAGTACVALECPAGQTPGPGGKMCQCTPPSTWSAGAQACVSPVDVKCSSGSKAVDGKCVVQCAGGNVVGGKCQCPPGKIWNAVDACIVSDVPGKCVGGKMVGTKCTCPTNMQLVNGQCTCLPNNPACMKQHGPPQPKCEGGKVVNGTCTCPSDKVLNDGVCVAKIKLPGKCGPGEKSVAGVCTVQCEGGKVVNKTCTCSGGKTPKDGICVAPAPVKCDGGTIVGNACKCPDNKVLNAGTCVAKFQIPGKCGPGQKSVNGVCVSQQPQAKPSPAQKKPVQSAQQKKKAAPPPCPKGQKRVNGKCVKA